MMTISERQFSSNNMSSYHKMNDKIIHENNHIDYNGNTNSNCSLITKRGFKPSDMFDPQKKEFLTNLSYKLFPVSWEDLENKHLLIGDKEVDLNKIFTPAPDAEENMIKKNHKTFASSAFYVPGIHPTVSEQMELARAISRSLSDSSNQMSKGQSMYVNRKKRSVKWVHEGKGRNTSNTCVTPSPTPSHDTAYRPPSSLRNQSQTPTKSFTTYPKPALKQTKETYNIPITKETYNIPITKQIYNVPIKQTNLNEMKQPSFTMFSGKNYNTAPRGWGQIKDYYRPVTFDDAGQTYLPYSEY